MWMPTSTSKKRARKLSKSTASIKQVLESIKIVITPFVKHLKNSQKEFLKKKCYLGKHKITIEKKTEHN